MYGDGVLGIGEWSYFGKEPSETAGSIVLSSLTDGPFACVVEGRSNNDYITVSAWLYECTESWIVVDHAVIGYCNDLLL